ncbi:MAG: hypothetical protein QOJ65_553 [Fimbriimonadaceae bacterium]|jgi:hypothetical protein|nr:hypothetical protein [Fimbriimonadaceae bacterium]
MTLRVPFELFSETVRRVVGTDEAYVVPTEGGCICTAFDMDKRLRVLTKEGGPPKAAREKLEKAGMKIRQGYWAEGDEDVPEPAPAVPYVASVAYTAANHQPGIWVDAYDVLPTVAQVLRSMYDVFVDTGELRDISIDEFVRLAHPNVVIISPQELLSYASAKDQ